MIQGTYFINNIPLVTIIDTGETHLFISAECVKRLNLEVSAMSGGMVTDAPPMGSITTTLICLKIPLNIFGREFGMDLGYLPLVQIDVILRMNSLELTMFISTVTQKQRGSHSWLKMNIC